MPSEANTRLSTFEEDREGPRKRRPIFEEFLTLSVSPESSRKLRFRFSIPKVGPSKPFPKQFDESLARTRARELYDLLNESATDSSEKVLWRRLAVAGKKLYDEVIPPEVGDQLQATVRGTALSLELSPKLAWIPWELLSYDKEEFLCTRFQIGRLLDKTLQEIHTARERLDEKQIGGVFIAIGETDEPEKAIKEGEAVEKIFKEQGKLAWFYRSLGADSLRDELTKSYDVLHFTGHGVYDAKSRERTGWKCKDGKLLSRKAIDDISSKTAVPLLIFANACVSAHMSLSASEGFITSLYHAFFRKGVPHYVGTLTQVPQIPAEKFANAFYHELVRGATIGEALWRVRLLFFDQPGAPIWAYYVHYGVPRERVFSETPQAESKQKEVSIITSLAEKARKRGLADENFHQLATPVGTALLDKFVELMAEADSKTRNSFTVTVDYDSRLESMIEDGQYHWKNPDITAKNFPIDSKGKVETRIDLVDLVQFKPHARSDEILRELDRLGMRPATLPELLALGATYPEKQREFWIVALGSVGRDKYGFPCFPCLCSEVWSDMPTRERYLSLQDEFGWGPGYRFAAVRE